MAEFVAFDPNVEIKGAAVLSTVAALGEEAAPILAKHGIQNPDPEGWYPQQAFLDAFREIAERGLLNMVAVGMRIPDTADFPPNIDTVEKALMLLNEAYHMNHRGGEIGGYSYERVGEREARMVCRNPYPSDFDYGIIYRLVQKFLPEDSTGFVVIRDDSVPNRKTGADTCVYQVRW